MAIWEQDPQNRPEVEKVTKNLKLPVWQAWYKGKFRDFWNECWGKIEDGYNKLGIDKVDKGGYTGTAKTLDDRISSVNNTLNSAKADKTINITAGNGLTGGGNLTTNRTISVGATDDSIIVGGTGIKVNTYNGLDGTSITRSLSANAGKLLNDKGLYPRNTLSGVVNLDNVVQQGLYDCSNLDKSSFTGYSGNYYSFGTLEVLVDNAGNITQKYIPHRYTGNILIRQKYHSSRWEEWCVFENSISLDKRIGTLPTSIDTSEKIFKALQGNVGIKFDEQLLYLNDTGTKRVGYCYLDKLKDGIFECILSTTSTVNNSLYFKNFSNKENSDKLYNLIKVETITSDLKFKKNGYVEFAFNGNFDNVIAITAFDIEDLACESCCINENKTILYLTFRETEKNINIKSASVLVTRLNR